MIYRFEVLKATYWKYKVRKVGDTIDATKEESKHFFKSPKRYKYLDEKTTEKKEEKLTDTTKEETSAKKENKRNKSGKKPEEEE